MSSPLVRGIQGWLPHTVKTLIGVYFYKNLVGAVAVAEQGFNVSYFHDSIISISERSVIISSEVLSMDALLPRPDEQISTAVQITAEPVQQVRRQFCLHLAMRRITP